MAGVKSIGDCPCFTEEAPIPPRYWWLKRIATTVGVLLALMIAARWWWGWYAHRQLQATIDRIITAGEPIYPEDFDPPEPIPDDQNAAKLLLDAAKALALTPDETKLIDNVLDDPALFQERFDDIRKLVESNTQALDLVHQAGARSAVDWGIRIRSPAIATMLPALSGQRTLRMFLSVTAWYHHAIGEDSVAIETLRDALAQARAIDAGPLMIPHLVALSIYTRTANAVETITPSLGIKPSGGDTSPDASPAGADQVRALIAELLNEEDVSRGLIRAFQSERMQQLDTVQSVLDGQMSLNQLGIIGLSYYPWVLELLPTFIARPIFCSDATFGIEWMSAYVEACRAPNWPATRTIAPAEPLELTNWERTVHPLTWLFMPSLQRSMLLHFRTLAMRRMAAITQAIRLYEVDHGRRPESLAELVPDYLPIVPLDPFAAHGWTISYRPDASPPVLYSIGTDGIDDGGAFTFKKGGGIDWEKLDIPFFLDGHRPQEPDEKPKRPESSQGGQHGGDEKNAGGNSEERQQAE